MQSSLQLGRYLGSRCRQRFRKKENGCKNCWVECVNDVSTWEKEKEDDLTKYGKMR